MVVLYGTQIATIHLDTGWIYLGQICVINILKQTSSQHSIGIFGELRNYRTGRSLATLAKSRLHALCLDRGDEGQWNMFVTEKSCNMHKHVGDRQPDPSMITCSIVQLCMGPSRLGTLPVWTQHRGGLR